MSKANRWSRLSLRKQGSDLGPDPFFWGPDPKEMKPSLFSKEGVGGRFTAGARLCLAPHVYILLQMRYVFKQEVQDRALNLLSVIETR